MQLFDRYLFSRFTGFSFLVTLALTALYLVVDFFDRIDNFIAAGAGRFATHYFLFKTPFIVNQILPVCALLGVVITLGVLSHRRELLVFASCGVSPWMVVRPLIFGAVLLGLAHLALAQWVLPVTLAVTNRIWYEDVSGQKTKGIERGGRTYHRGREGIYSFMREGDERQRFTSFTYTTLGGDSLPVSFYAAGAAIFAEGKWHLQDVVVKTTAADGTVSTSHEAELVTDLPEGPDAFFVPHYREAEASLLELWQRAKAVDATPERRAEFHRLFSFALLGLPLAILSIPVMLLLTQRLRRDLSLALPLSCAIAFAAWGWWSACLALAAAGRVALLPAAWNIHLVATGAGFWLLARQAAGKI